MSASPAPAWLLRWQGLWANSPHSRLRQHLPNLAGGCSACCCCCCPWRTGGAWPY